MRGSRYERLPGPSERLTDTDRVNFGKHTDLTYPEVLDQHPDFADWAEKPAGRGTAIARC